MSESRVDRLSESRRLIREELLTNILVEAGAGSGKTQMLAERMAAGVAAGVYQVEHMAAVTFTRKAASELRGRFHLALETQLLGRRRRGRGLERRTAPRASMHALSQSRALLRRHHSLLLRAPAARAARRVRRVARLHRARRGAGPRAAQARLARLHHQRAQPPAIRTCWRSSTPASARRISTPPSRPSACNEDVEFPPGDGAVPRSEGRVEGARDVLEGAAEAPAGGDRSRTRPARFRRPRVQFRGQLRVSRYRLDRPSVIASLLETWDCESKIVQKRWADSAAEKKRLQGPDRARCTPTSARRSSTPYLAQWRQYVYRLVGDAADARARARRGASAAGVNSLNYGDLLNLTARVLRENAAGPPRAAAEVSASVRRRVPGHRPGPGRDRVPAGGRRDRRRAPAPTSSAPHRRTGAPSRCVPARSSSSATPSSRSTASAAPTSTSTTSSAQRFSDPAIGRVAAADDELPVGAGAVRLGERRLRRRGFPTEPTAHSPRFAALDSERRGTQRHRAASSR